MPIVNLLEKALNIRAFYHKILASNIANVETPGYKEKDVDFRAELERSLAQGSTESIAVKEKQESDIINSIDGNTVNIEGQMVKLAENDLMYTSLVQLINKKFSKMRYAINEGRR